MKPQLYIPCRRLHWDEQVIDRSCSPADWPIAPQAGIVALSHDTASRTSKSYRQLRL